MIVCFQVSHLPPVRSSRKALRRCSVQIAASYRETGQTFDVAAAARQKVRCPPLLSQQQNDKYGTRGRAVKEHLYKDTKG